MRISIVIPYYKGKEFINCAVMSVLNQPYKNLEVIIINDGSPDDDKECVRLANSDSRVVYLKKENDGIGATRNLGISVATGEYIVFLDQDDIWCNGFLDHDLVSRISRGGDIFSFTYYVTNSDFTRAKNIAGVSAVKEIEGGYNAVSSIWKHHSSFIFRRQFLVEQKIEYALVRHEDEIFLKKALYKADKITFIDKPIFCYRNNPLSETHRKLDPIKLYVPIFNAWLELLKWYLDIDSEDKEIERLIKNMICIYAMEAIKAFYQYGYKDDYVLDVVQQHFPNKILTDFENILYNDARKEDYRSFYNDHKNFLKSQKKTIMVNNIGRFVIKIPGVRKLYYRKKYPCVMPKNLIS